MNIERVSLSDIDTDFPPSRIEEVKDYIFSKTGLYCSDIITFNTIADKGAIRDVGRALEIPLDEVDEICKAFESNEEKLRKKYPELFKYVDLLLTILSRTPMKDTFLAGYAIITQSNSSRRRSTSTSIRKKRRWL